MLKEFREFALKGNVVDLAIGVIIGAAFSQIVQSIVSDLFMPMIAWITRGGVDFSNYFLPLSGDVTATSLEAARAQGAVIAYGSFITAAINFLIVAWVLFLVVKGINEVKRKAERNKPPEPAPEVTADVQLLTEIRDLLANRARPSV
jgi:large conductance mechanosensitive channel